VADVFRDLDSPDPERKASAAAIVVASPVAVGAALIAVGGVAAGGGAAAAGSSALATISAAASRLAGMAGGAEKAAESVESDVPVVRLGEPARMFPSATSWGAVFRSSDGEPWTQHWLEDKLTGNILYDPNLRPWTTFTAW